MPSEPSTPHPAERVSASDRPLLLTEHLEELRRRIGVSLGVLMLACAVCFTQVERIIDWLQLPAGGLLPRLAVFTPTEALTAYLKVAGMAGLIVAMPIMLAQLWGFIRIGMTEKERRYGLMFVGWGSVLFAAGVAFAYFVLLPASLRVLLSIGRHSFEPYISLDRYLGFVLTVIGWCGAVFELPILLVALAKAGIVTPEWLRQQRPYAILAMAIAAALLTPTTDAVNLLLMMVPMILLYEISIPLAKWAAR